MKKIFFFVCLSLFTSLVSSAQEKRVKAKTESKIVFYRVTIDFISVGNGIVNTSFEKMETFIKNHPKKPAYKIIPKGKEGEKSIYLL